MGHSKRLEMRMSPRLSSPSMMSRAKAGVLAAFLILEGVGCAEPQILVTVPTKGAAAARGKKAKGDTKFMMLGSEGMSPAILPFERDGTFAQSGEGTLGDRVFRENPFSMVEGCRWVEKGRICNLAKLPGGGYLGGGVSWIIPRNAAATPRAGGWVARGILHSANSSVFDANAASALSDVFSGEVFHCRFSDDGPVCFPAVTEQGQRSHVLLGVHSLRDGDKVSDVLWLATFGETTSEPGGEAGRGVKDIYRCETSEEATEVTCKKAAVR